MFKRARLALAVIIAGAFAGLGAAQAATPASIPMKKDGGVYVVPVSVNGQVTIDCIVDSGASDVNIPTEIFQRLVRSGSVQKSDYMGMQDYTLADGSTERGRTFRIKFLKVGGVVVKDVVASVGGDGSSALLGQSFLERFQSWSLDNSHHALVLVGTPAAAPARPGPHGGPAAKPDPTIVAQVRGGHGGHEDDSPSAASTPQSSDEGLSAQDSQ